VKYIFFQNSAVYYLFFYFFIIFDILFLISCICTCQQILEIFMCFYFMDERFYQRILENHRIFFKKICTFEIQNKFHRLLFVFYFQHFGNLFFLFHLSKLVKKFKTFLWCFIARITDFIREF